MSPHRIGTVEFEHVRCKQGYQVPFNLLGVLQFGDGSRTVSVVWGAQKGWHFDDEFIEHESKYVVLQGGGEIRHNGERKRFDTGSVLDVKEGDSFCFGRIDRSTVVFLEARVPAYAPILRA